jgi:hypothetical protein
MRSSASWRPCVVNAPCNARLAGAVRATAASSLYQRRKVLCQRLTGADVFIEDTHFATLDTTTRPSNWKQPAVLLTDTVASFAKCRSSRRGVQVHLEEPSRPISCARGGRDHPDAVEHYEVTEQVRMIWARRPRKPSWCTTRIDREYDPHMPVRLRANNPDCFEVSAGDGAGIGGAAGARRRVRHRSTAARSIVSRRRATISFR